MPATAGKVRMPAGNRVTTSSSLSTHSIWQNAIGYDPYAADNAGADNSVTNEAAANAHDNMKALLAIARNKNAALEATEPKGAWRGGGTLKGGIRDYGELPAEAAPAGSAAAHASLEMPSSTSSWTSDEDDDDDVPSSAAQLAHKSAGDRGAKRERSDGGGGGERGHTSSRKEERKEKKHKSEKRKHEKSKKSKSHKHEKKHKSEKHRKHEKNKRHKHRGSDSS